MLNFLFSKQGPQSMWKSHTQLLSAFAAHQPACLHIAIFNQHFSQVSRCSGTNSTLNVTPQVFSVVEVMTEGRPSHPPYPRI